METSNHFPFDRALEELTESGWTLVDEVFDSATCRKLSDLIEQRFQRGELKPALVGSPQQPQRHEQIRGDHTVWLESDEKNPELRKVLELLDELMGEMNHEFFLGLKRYEAHIAYYPPGQGYAKHYDQHRGTANRKITFILYLNTEWKKGDGGELSVYSAENENQLLMQVEPIAGRLFLFRTELFPHQVETASKNRKSITGWFRSDAL